MSGELDRFLERGRVRRGRDYGRLLEDISRRRRELAEDVINVYRRVSPIRNPVLRRVLEVVAERKREVEPRHPDPKVTFGVDGGEGMREYQGVVLYMTRAAAWSEADVFSSWDFGVLSRTRTPQIRVAARRVKLESDVATRAVERGGEVVMLDGPIVPHHDLKGANEDSPNRRDYWGRVLDARRTMLEACEEEGAVVMGIVEDCKA
ncbi:DNA double-strand break repair nuclease NurA, partial [Methanopyrus sp.]